MRIRILAAGLLVGALALTACGKQGSPADEAGGTSGGAQPPTYPVAQHVEVPGSATFAAIQGRGGLTVGVKDDQPGLGLKDPTTGQYTGFDVEIAKLVAAGLGYDPSKIKFTTVDSAAREAAIANGNVDYYVGSYTITDKRKQQVSFAGPYFQAGQDLLVRADDNSITGPDTLKGKRVCSITGSTPIQRVREGHLTDPGGQIVEFQKYSQCVEKLGTHEVDAVTTDDAILKGYAAQDSSLKVVGKPFSQEPYGVGLNRDDAALRNKIDDILQAALDDGTWQKIYDATLGKSGAPVTKPTIQRY
jgi:glutamate transport system substrate-binding protein